MFQFAAGLALSLRHDTGIELDARSFERDRLRKFSLFNFGLRPTTATETLKKWPPVRRGLVNFPWWKIRHGIGVQYVRERGPISQENIAQIGPSAYLHGYWQNERYFADHASEVRRALRIVSPIDPTNQKWLDRIRDRAAISVHVRRSDYTTDAVNQNLYATCDLNYYVNSAEYLAENISSKPYFMVFSDDPEWSAANLRLPGEADFVAHNSGDAFIEDLRLMSACRHHIIANSTFSWWGAWLGENPDRTIVAPANWYRDAVRDLNNPIPPNWIRIPLMANADAASM
ncbi:Glycosyl transferase family 11 [Neorhodopirellula pilleata]|uniref:Glycosyl transferase family 11 n=2 Tax=Neorhodopirellula pilleata TaxID=2714738 RepID=A0A5C5ZGA0_9BACT|nr:Glycosyl transferase family 11 [Neorhodopirellula pilleata]